MHLARELISDPVKSRHRRQLRCLSRSWRHRLILGNYDPPAMMPVMRKIRELIPSPAATPKSEQTQKR